MSSTEILVAVVVAVIGGSGIPVWLLTRLDRKNDSQHADNKSLLEEIRQDVSGMKSDVSSVKSNLIKHLENHLETQDGIEGRVSGREPRSRVQGGRAGAKSVRRGT